VRGDKAQEAGDGVQDELLVVLPGRDGTKGQPREVQVGAPIQKIHGNLTGLKPEQIRRIEQLYRRRISPDRIVTQEIARQITEPSRELNRQIGILVNRRGDVEAVIVGSHRDILIPSLDRFRFAASRLRGLRLVHSHLNGESLTEDDLTDLALLRLDLVCAVLAGPDGLPGVVHTAHLVPENPEGTYWAFLKPVRPPDLNLNFASFISDLESAIAKRQTSRRVDAADRAILVRVETNPMTDTEASLTELRELCRTSGVEVFDAVVQQRPQPDPRYLLGKGKLADVVIRALQMGANCLLFDHELSPAQARSIADFTELKVVDRTQVILDIFAQRAHSREGKIQVELAQLNYRLPRLAQRNTAFSRLAGGIGGRGPGEQKLEIDRRRVRDRIHRLERELKEIEKARGQRRMRRRREGIPIISIVGYTNAGKSTLLNALTHSRVLAEDRLFATLDPKSSRLRFPRDTEAIITDTVGFIRNLPRELMAAFRATLDELQEADLLLHVIDVSNPGFEEQIEAVENILRELDIAGKPLLKVLNKADRIDDPALLGTLSRRYEAPVVSALHPETLPALLARLESVIGSHREYKATAETEPMEPEDPSLSTGNPL
jgi:GTP-binding protein HflX